MDLPDGNETYKLQEYWDERFSVEDNFEWCKSYSDFKHLIHEHMPKKNERILMLGCGNSSLSEEMYYDGYTNIVNIDYSPIIIEKMRRKHKHLVGMQYMLMDITRMTFDKNSFDVVMEKGTLDALLVDEKNLWNPSEHSCNTMDTVLFQISHILKSGGRFISVTFSQPHFRKPYLAKTVYDWSISTNTFGDYFHYFLYVMDKGRELSEHDKVLMEVNDKKISDSVTCTSSTELDIEYTEDFLHNITLFL